MTSDLLVKASDPTTKEYKYVETILKGYETPLPSGISFLDKDGNRRYSMRTQWWKDGATCLGDVSIPPDIELGSARDLSVPTDMPSYDREGKPCFIGHYWLRGKRPIVCLLIWIASVVQLLDSTLLIESSRLKILRLNSR